MHPVPPHLRFAIIAKDDLTNIPLIIMHSIDNGEQIGMYFY